MTKIYSLLYILISGSLFSQTILNQQEGASRTVQDPNVVVLAPGFHATSSLSDPFVAKIGAATENGGGGPTTPSTAGSGNPSGTTSPQGTSFHDTQGNIEVNGGGQLQFTLPIALPPGVRSVGPQINLVYTSGSGNGIAGYGWNISGITAISRVGRNIERDGEVRGVQLDYSDYYSFNGQRLVLKSGEYGKDGAEYVTEKFSNVKIRSVGSIAGQQWKGPEYWEVTFEDGSQAWYGGVNGGSGNARTPMEYNIVKWRDAQGNYITYNYTQSNNVAVISSIQWGGNETLSKAHFNDIQLTYTDRDLFEGSYVNGIQFIQQRILTEIIVNTSDSLFKKYEIAYKKQGSNYHVVDYIREKNSINQEANAVVFENIIDVTASNTFRQDSRYDDIYGMYVKSGDFDGDGQLDFINHKKLMLSRLNGNNKFINVDYEGHIITITTTKQNNTLLNRQSIVTYNAETATLNFYYLNANEILEKYSSISFDLSETDYYFDGGCVPDDEDGFCAPSYLGFKEIVQEGDFNGDGLSEIYLLINSETVCNCFDKYGFHGVTYYQQHSKIGIYVNTADNSYRVINQYFDPIGTWLLF